MNRHNRFDRRSRQVSHSSRVVLAATAILLAVGLVAGCTNYDPTRDDARRNATVIAL